MNRIIHHNAKLSKHCMLSPVSPIYGDFWSPVVLVVFFHMPLKLYRSVPQVSGHTENIGNLVQSLIQIEKKSPTPRVQLGSGPVPRYFWPLYNAWTSGRMWDGGARDIWVRGVDLEHAEEGKQ
jgi:hypothetical protein